MTVENELDIFKKKPVEFVILKLANTCNMNCSYCYWFKDQSVYSKSKLIKESVLIAFYEKLRNHLIKYKLKIFSIVLHGGEPLLVGKKKMEDILFNINIIQIELNVTIYFIIQTNGILLDNEWINILRSYNVTIGISMDGPKEIHDEHRKDLRGLPTYEKTVAAIKLLQERNIKFGVLAVYNPLSDANETCNFFIEQLGVRNLDVLIPNVNYESEEIPKIKDYYIDLFNLWIEKYADKGISIKIAKNILNTILGRKIHMQSIGYAPEQSCMIKPDGEMEASDSLHAIGDDFTKGVYNILENELNDIENDSLWNEVYQSSTDLHSKCQTCKFKMLCGGGHICSRWSLKNRFNNPSVYCDQLYEIFKYATDIVEKKAQMNNQSRVAEVAKF